MDIDSPPMVLGRFKAEKNNRTYKIRIEHLTRNLMEQALDHMNAYFIAREPMTLNCNMTSDPVSLQELMALWRKTIEQGASLVAILEEEESDMPGNIVGVNLTGISYKDKEETTKVEGVLWANIFNVLTTITNEANLFKKYNVDKYLTGLGLSVHPDYHGLGIGFKLLEAREPLCKAIGIRMTATVFTAASSQYIASKAGFEANIEHNFKEYNINGVIHFPDLEGKLVLMVKRYN